ncbi:MAG: MFS transporter [Phycisphaerales bacterium]
MSQRIAQPEMTEGWASVPRWRVAAHVIALVLCWSTVQATDLLMPVIAKKAFGATPWQVVLITAAPMVLMVLSIFWADRLKRQNITKYLVIYWAVAMLPMAAMAVVHGYWALAAVYVFSCFGKAAWPVVNGEILKHIYPDSVRGRVFGGVTTASLAVSGLMSWGLGECLHKWPDSYRYFLPILAGVQLFGVLLFAWIAEKAGASKHRVLADPHEGHVFKRVLEPLTHTREVLREDNVFARYEAAFMTYGIGWMVFYALLPLVGTERLHLDYDQMAAATHMPFQISRAACTFIAGWMMDRYGAMKTCAVSFGVYAFVPLLLAGAQGQAALTVACVLWGVAAAGVDAGWMLGPVALAPSKAKVPQYVAIHATMVGVRGSLFQLLGVGLYTVTGSFAWPLVIGAASFVWASWQMVALKRMVPREPR